jgi:hypothetical protein
MLTPKIGTGESLICGPNLVKKSRPAEEDFFRRFSRDGCGRQFASVRQKDCLHWFRGIVWWRGLGGRDEWMDKHSHLGVKIRYQILCSWSTRSLARTGYKYEAWMYVIVIEHSHNKPALRQTFESFSCVVEFFERVHRSVDLRKYRQPCIMSSIMRWI